MSMINWADAAVQAAAIESAGAVIAALIAAVIASVIGRQFADRKKLQEKLTRARMDILYLLEVEAEHCKLHLESSGATHRLRVRKTVLEKGMSWSGKFTPSQIRKSLSSIS